MKSFIFRFIILSIIVTICISCKKQIPSEQKNPGNIPDMTNIQYGQETSQNFSLVLPSPSRHLLPVIILLHGGSWSGGQKEDLNYIARRFADYGFAAFSVDYRLSSSSIHGIDMIQDIQTMVNYIENMSIRLNLDKNRISFFGYSAGAHLAMLYAYNSPQKVKSVISIAGPTDILDSSLLAVPGMYNALLQVVGDTIRDHWIQFNPIHFINYFSPSTLMIHGLNDETVPVNQSVRLCDALNKAGGYGKTILIENQYHAFTEETFEKYLPEIVSFVMENHKE